MVQGGSSIGLARSDVADVYDRTAAVYDRFTAHHDYELWIGNLLPALARRGLHHGRLLDVACGTAKSFIPMLKRGWSVVGVDISERMLDVARSKVGDAAELQRHDMRDLPQLGRFELVWCLDDAVNYLLDTGELEACLAGLRRNLSDDGLCVFDVNTLASYAGFFASTEHVEDESGRLTWRGHEGRDFAAGALAAATLEVETAATRERIVHRQRHFPPAQIEMAIAASGLDLLATYGITTAAVLEQPLDESRHTKAIFVAGRAQRR